MDNKTSDTLDEFMLAEFETLTNRVLNIEQTRATRVNFYIVLVTALFGGLVLTLQNQVDTALIVILAPTLSFFVLLLGLALLTEYVELAAQVVLLYRRAGRIRCWFHDRNPKVLPYLPWMPGDDTPPFKDDPGFATFAGRDSILWLGNSVSGATSIFFISKALLLPIYSSVIISIGMFVLVWLAQNLYLRRLMNKYERIGMRTNSIHFPKADRVSILEEEKVFANGNRK